MSTFEEFFKRKCAAMDCVGCKCGDMCERDHKDTWQAATKAAEDRQGELLNKQEVFRRIDRLFHLDSSDYRSDAKREVDELFKQRLDAAKEKTE